MPTLHIIDYVLPGARIEALVAEVANRLPQEEFSLGIVSYGETLSRYGALAGRLTRPVSLIETPALGHRFAVALGEEAQFAGRVTHEVLADTFADADLVWFPWIHDHLFAAASMIKAVASFHDPAPVEMAEFLAEKSGAVEAAACTGMAAMADMATRRLMLSLAGVAAGSERIAAHLAGAYAPKFRLPKAVPLPSPSLLTERALPVPLPVSPYILYCGSIQPAGNHETLLTAAARLKREGHSLHLALAGEGTERIGGGHGHREAYLRGLIDHLGLEIGSDLTLLGALDPGALKTAFSQSAGAVLPALAEGEAMIAGAQALELGLPLACSDLPEMRGYFTRRGAAPLWFRPGASEEIASSLVQLAMTPRGTPAALADTGWDEVAGQYLTLFREQSILAATRSGGG